ncbi:hypothetical protein LY76DRAFT_405160 [Colletotrichum caudatum]|nr:hypothetical protein LY76DRAFT_405160 [Colletotrichum caudatum]
MIAVHRIGFWRLSWLSFIRRCFGNLVFSYTLLPEGPFPSFVLLLKSIIARGLMEELKSNRLAPYMLSVVWHTLFLGMHATDSGVGHHLFTMWMPLGRL